MKEENTNKKDLIARYLLGQLEGKELQQFSLRLLRDKSLQQEVDANRLLMKTLWKANQDKDKPSPSNGFSKWWFLLLPLVAVLLSLPFFFQSPAEQAPTSEPIQNIDDAPGLEEAPAGIEGPKEEEEEEKKKEVKEDEQVPDNRPIAANFEPNAMLEVLIDNPVRSSVLQITIHQPTPSTTLLLQNNTARFELSGQLTLAEVSSDLPNLVCHFFSNQEAAFENFEPLFSQSITLNNTAAANFNFAFQRQLTEIVPGLYYFIIEEAEGDLLYAGKVFIKA